MKVLWFSNTPAGAEEILKLGGTRGGWLISLEKALKDKVDLSVAFYYARFSEPFKHKGVSYFPICKKNWKVNIIKERLFGSFIDRQDLSIYLDIINKVEPDIIHIHGTENPFGCLMGEIDIPVVLSYQGSCTAYNHKYFSGIERFYASLKGIKIWSPYSWIFNKSYNQGFRKSARHRKREIRNLKFCKHIIGRTDWDRRITRILAPGSVYYHNDEILRDSFYQKQWENPDNKKIIVHTTTGEAIWKGFETVCQALYELNKIGIDIEWRVAGVSKSCLLVKVVKKKLKEYYPSKGLVLLGNLHEQELIEKMLEADIFVLSSHIENSPNSLCEAMMLGMPCISTYVGGTSSLLTDKQEGLMIQDGDPWSMAGTIMESLQNHELAIDFGRNARMKALDRHNPHKIVNDLLVIYQQITDESQ
jgi:glycosyltransferase involved in cell wall biosynthesis